MVAEPTRWENRGAPLPGFDWTGVQWGAPDAPRTEVCSYCGDERPEDSVPLILWNKDGWCAEFCDHCQATYWGIQWDEGPVEPRHCSVCAKKNPALLGPGYWLHKTTGVLRPAVARYLRGEQLSPQDVAALRAYLRQWINAPCWEGERIGWLREAVDDLTTRRAIDRWLLIAVDEGLDPL